MPTALTRLLGPWRPGDLDGFLALGLNNLIQILLIISLCRGILGYPDALLFGQILPAAGVSLLVGNLVYSFLARRLAAREQRSDCTALPYGINTVSLFAYIFLVMLPVKLAALNSGLPGLRPDRNGGLPLMPAWRSCSTSGLR